MTFLDLIQKVKDDQLSREDLEKYRDQISHLYVQMQLELSSIEKLEAMFMHGKDPDESVAARKIAWKAQPEGQRLIVLKRYSLAAKELLNSLKSRIYAQL